MRPGDRVQPSDVGMQATRPVRSASCEYMTLDWWQVAKLCRFQNQLRRVHANARQWGCRFSDIEENSWHTARHLAESAPDLLFDPRCTGRA